MTEESHDDFVSDMRTLTKPLGARVALRELVKPISFGEKAKSVIGRAAKCAGFSYSRAFEIWYGRARRIEEFETEALKEALEKRRREIARNEFHELKIRMARLEARLAQTDAEFHRETIEALSAAQAQRR
jgi:hypothetical protein